MGCSSSSTRSQFKHGEPKNFTAKKVTPCFADRDNGLLFRLEDKDGRWAYYNDTLKYDMRVTLSFHPDSKIEPLGDTKLTTKEDTNEQVVTIIVPPTETVLVIKGKVNGFKAKMAAYPAGSGAGERKEGGGGDKKQDDDKGGEAPAQEEPQPVETATEEEAQSPVEKGTPKNK